jgi:hypothetical protein
MVCFVAGCTFGDDAPDDDDDDGASASDTSGATQGDDAPSTATDDDDDDDDDDDSTGSADDVETQTSAEDTSDAGETWADESASGTDDGPGGTTESGGPETVTMTGLFVTFGDSAPLAGVEICVEDPAGECALSDAAGTFTVAVPAAGEYEIIAGLDGYVPINALFEGAGHDLVFSNQFLTVEQGGFFVQLIGGSNDPTLAVGTFNIYELVDGVFPEPDESDLAAGIMGIAGATVALDPAAGVLGYVGLSGLPDPTLTATTLAGLGGFADVPEGDYDIAVVTPEGYDCNWGPLANDGDTVRIRARAGHAATIFRRCIAR